MNTNQNLRLAIVQVYVARYPYRFIEAKTTRKRFAVSVVFRKRSLRKYDESENFRKVSSNNLIFLFLKRRKRKVVQFPFFKKSYEAEVRRTLYFILEFQLPRFGIGRYT